MTAVFERSAPNLGVRAPLIKLSSTTSLDWQSPPVIQQSAAPATFMCFLVRTRGFGGALQRGAPLAPTSACARRSGGPVGCRERAAGRCGSGGGSAGGAWAQSGARIRAAHVRPDAFGPTAAAPHRGDASQHRKGLHPRLDRRSRSVNRDQVWGAAELLVALPARRCPALWANSRWSE